MIIRRLRILLLVAIVATGCSPADSAPDPKPAPQQTKTEESSAPAPIADAIGHIKTVTRDGEPLAAMIPIATRRPNAFDTPLSKGELTDAEGRSSLLLPQGEQLYVRAWDPSFGYFSNNFFTILPNPGEATDEMVITMVESAKLTAEVRLPNGEPIAHEEVSILLTHPTQGPWWPTRAQSDDTGIVVFEGLPPGEFIARFETTQGHAHEVPGVFLPPGGEERLEKIQLQ